MKIYTIEYNTNSHLNVTVEIKAKNYAEAMYLFNKNCRNATEIISVEVTK